MAGVWRKSCSHAARTVLQMTDTDLPPSLGVSLLSLRGFSAYVGLLDGGKPKEGDVLVVSGASGGVGSVLVQIARILGCLVIGIAGGPEKAEHTRSLGCHDTIDRVVNISRISELLEIEPSDLVDYLTSLGDSGNDCAFFIYHHQARFSEAGGRFTGLDLRRRTECR
tara:strand:- start:636 stop:1136 length:501 start_codon:yes stop_codon:yes gene_type:complete